jgi:hypothetical protein
MFSDTARSPEVFSSYCLDKNKVAIDFRLKLILFGPTSFYTQMQV